MEDVWQWVAAMVWSRTCLVMHVSGAEPQLHRLAQTHKDRGVVQMAQGVYRIRWVGACSAEHQGSRRVTLARLAALRATRA